LPFFTGALLPPEKWKLDIIYLQVKQGSSLLSRDCVPIRSSLQDLLSLIRNNVKYGLARHPRFVREPFFGGGGGGFGTIALPRNGASNRPQTQ
jgi:hypothetical protein